MALDLKKLTEWLDITHPDLLVDLKRAIIQALDNSRTMRTIIDRQCEYRHQTNCDTCENEVSCLALNGVAYLALDEIDFAINELENANQQFRYEGKTWNYIIGLTLMGMLYEKSRKDHRAFREYEQAHNLLENNYLRAHTTEYGEISLDLKKELQAKLDELNPYSPRKKTVQPGQSRLALPWIPAYTSLQVGPNGPFWPASLSEDKDTFVAKVILEGKLHNVHPLKQGDNLIVLVKSHKYGWAKVPDDSMNGLKPISILENDFVLFYESATASNNAIVIAACSTGASTSYQHAIKRYSQSTESLFAETEPPNRYGPMPIIGGTKIMGVVIAVAKASN